MPRPTLPELLKLLPKTNCRDCGQVSCMAFAVTVLQGRNALSRCPHVDSEAAERIGNVEKKESTRPGALVERRDEIMGALKDELRRIDFAEAAARLDAEFRNDRLGVRCLGKIFELDRNGDLHADCHVNGWVHLPVLNYAARGRGRDEKGEWVIFSELKNARDWAQFFSHRCERGLREIVDRDPGLFFDALDMFAAKPAEAKAGEAFGGADYAVVLRPLPKVPLLIAYWEAEGEFEAKLTLFFDRTAEENLGAEAVYMLVTGILEMLRRVMTSHAARV